MARFYGKVSGSAATPASRCAEKSSALEALLASISGAVKVTVWFSEREQKDMVSIEKIPHTYKGKTSGEYKLLYCGPIGE